MRVQFINDPTRGKKIIKKNSTLTVWITRITIDRSRCIYRCARAVRCGRSWTVAPQPGSFEMVGQIARNINGNFRRPVHARICCWTSRSRHNVYQTGWSGPEGGASRANKLPSDRRSARDRVGATAGIGVGWGCETIYRKRTQWYGRRGANGNALPDKCLSCADRLPRSRRILVNDDTCDSETQNPFHLIVAGFLKEIQLRRRTRRMRSPPDRKRIRLWPRGLDGLSARARA